MEESATQSHDVWLAPVIPLLAAQSQQGILVSFPEYRPDLARTMASQLNLFYFDYRAEIMANLGWEANEVTLSELERELQRRSDEQGMVAFNVEALLATKAPAERQHWLSHFMTLQWDNPLLLPLMVFSSEAPVDERHVVLQELPPETLIGRLVN